MTRALQCLAAGMALAGGWVLAGPSTRPAATATASRPASAPASGPAVPATLPTVDRRAIDKLVVDLGSRQYRTRVGAQEQLSKLVDLPGVADILKRHLAGAKDPEVKSSLEGALAGLGEPVALIWYLRGLRQVQRGLSPCLFIRADGRFVYDAGSFIFTGKDAAPKGDTYRQGKLTIHQLWALKQKIKAALTGSGAGAGRVGAVKAGWAQVTFHARSGRSRRTVQAVWEPAAFRRGTTPGAGAAADIKLAAALRDFLAQCPAKGYDGPMALHMNFNPAGARRLSLADRRKLPAFPVKSVNILDARARTGGLPLTDKELKAARKALGETIVYRYSTSIPIEVLLAPYIEEASEIIYGRR